MPQFAPQTPQTLQTLQTAQGQSYAMSPMPTSPPTTGSPAWKDDLGRFSPSAWLTHGQSAPNSWGAAPNAAPLYAGLSQYITPPVASYAASPAATKGMSKGRRASIIIALMLVILLIVVSVLFATGAFSHLTGQSAPPALALAAICGKQHYRRKICSDA